MRICLISREHASDNHAGGIGTYTEKTARGLAAVGHTVHVITETAGERSVIDEEGVQVHRLPAPRSARLRTLIRARAVAHELNSLSWEPDVVQACEFGAEASLYALWRPAHTKLVTRLATPSFLVRRLNGASPRAAQRQVDFLERFQTRRSDAIISITAALARVVTDEWTIAPERMRVIKTGVDFRKRFASAGSELEPELRGRQYLIYFGRLEERKGVHILAQALPGVLAAHPDLHFVFAGNSLDYHGRPMREFVERCNEGALDRVHFYPRLPQRELYTLLAGARFAVLPSLWEGMGNVVLEALDIGKPVLATRGSGFQELVEDGISGLLVPPGDVTSLQDAMLELLADPERIARMSEAARRRAEAFSLDVAVGDLAEFYEQLINVGMPTKDGRPRLGRSSSAGSERS
jgi:glycogen(starch) synthase